MGSGFPSFSEKIQESALSLSGKQISVTKNNLTKSRLISKTSRGRFPFYHLFLSINSLFCELGSTCNQMIHPKKWVGPHPFFKGRGCLRRMKKCYPCIEFKLCELNNE